MRGSADVIVVGARCAGSPLAALLAKQGVDVVVVERATFPRDTLSTHLFEADALAFLDRLGVSDRLRQTGAPFMRRVANRTEGRPLDGGVAAESRRHRRDRAFRADARPGAGLGRLPLHFNRSRSPKQ